MKKIKETEKIEINVSDKEFSIRAVKVFKVNDSFLRIGLTETGGSYSIWYDGHGWVSLSFGYMTLELERKWMLRILDILNSGRNNNETKLLVRYVIDKQFSDFRRKMEWYY